MNCALKRCSALKTASGTAKHRLLSATTLSRPRASAMAFLTAHKPITNSAIPSAQAATTGGEAMRNDARSVCRMGKLATLAPIVVRNTLRRRVKTESRRFCGFWAGGGSLAEARKYVVSEANAGNQDEDAKDAQRARSAD